MINPKKSLGQNFLKDKNIARKIVDLLDLEQGDVVLEIGPGTGALTRLLLDYDIHLTAVELDERACAYLKSEFDEPGNPGFTLLNRDFAEFDLREIIKPGKKLKVIGNIPYNISGKVLSLLFENAEYIKSAVITVQKEVAQRLTASPGNKDFGILTVALQLRGRAKKEFDIPAQCFKPPPNVMSSVVKIDFFNRHIPHFEFESIMSLVRSAFNQRRKTLKNSLKNYIESTTDKSILEFIDLVVEKSKSINVSTFSKRAEQLSIDDFMEITKFYKEVYLYKKNH